MFKFLRKYDKIILAVGISLLMIAFLIQGTLSMFQQSREGIVVGRVNGKKIKIGDQDAALGEKRVLGEISPLLRLDFSEGGVEERDESLVWLLSLEDAKAMGLSVGPGVVDQMLAALGKEEGDLKALATKINASQGFIRRALADWAVVQQYQDLANGFVPISPVERLERLGEASRLQAQGEELMKKMRAEPEKYRESGQFLMYQIGEAIRVTIDSARSSPRTSVPVAEHYVQDHRSRVKASYAVVSVSRGLAEAPEAGAEVAQELFNKYKDKLMGEGRPYGFGYRFPGRVKIEYLAVPLERLKGAVKIEETEALAYYEEHGEEFRDLSVAGPQTPGVGGKGALRSYIQVRESILERLRIEKAGVVGDRMMKEAQGILLDEVRRLEDGGGYKVIARGWKGKSLEEVAGILQERSEKLGAVKGVLPDVVRHNAEWLDKEGVEGLEGIGLSFVWTGQPVDRRRMPPMFGDYVMSAKELSVGTAENALASYRLQVGVPSVPMVSSDGGRYLFRLLDAEGEHTPGSLEEVRLQVSHNAKQLVAYRRLQGDRAWYLRRLREKGLAVLAKELGLEVTDTDYFTRRVMGPKGAMVPPYIAGVGEEEQFVDGVFELGDRAAPEGGSGSDQGVQRVDVLAVDGRLSLYLVELKGHESISRSEFEKLMTSVSTIPVWVFQNTVGVEGKPAGVLKALEARSGFVSSRGKGSEDSE